MRSHVLLLATVFLALSVVPASDAGAPAAPEWKVEFLPMDPAWAGASAVWISAGGSTVAGMAWLPDGNMRGVVWDKGEWVTLGPPSGSADEMAVVYDMNEHGLATGYTARFRPAWEGPRAAVWDTKNGTATDLHPDGIVLDGVTFTGSIPGFINARGDISGYLMSSVFAKSRAYVWSHNGKSDHALPLIPGSPGSLPGGINDGGDVVGICFVDGGASRHACLWPAGGGVVDLHPEILGAFPSLKITLTLASDIRSDGTIVGNAYVRGDDGVERVRPYQRSADGEIRLLDIDGNTTAPAGVITGSWVSGALGGTWWIPEEPSRVALWRDGVLHTPALPAEFGWTELWYVNRHGDAAGQAFHEDTLFELTFPTPFVLRCTKGK